MPQNVQKKQPFRQ